MNLTPQEIPLEFWTVIESAEGNRTKMRVILEQMTREEIIVFHRQFLFAAMAIATQEYVKYMRPGTSEDGVDDLSRWVVGQGKSYYLSVYENLKSIPADVEPHSNAHIYYEIPRVFILRFSEDIWSADDDYE